MIVFSLSSKGFATFQATNGWAMWTAVIAILTSLICIYCVHGVARAVPMNYILCLIFTLAEAYLVSFTTTKYDSNTVLAAGLMTLGVTIGLTIYACTTKTDFTLLCGGAWIFIFALLSLVLCVFLIPNDSIAHRLYALIGVIIYGFYLIFDI
jgi:hypothetical protein